MRQIGGPAEQDMDAHAAGEPLPAVALVDEDTVWSTAAAMALSAQGFRIQVYSTVGALMDARCDDKPDIVAVDVSAPLSTPLALYARLRSDARFVMCPIMLLTRSGSDEAIERLCRESAVETFYKVAHWTALATRLKQTFRLIRAQRELLLSQERLAVLHDFIRVGCFDFDLETREFRGGTGSSAIIGFEQPRLSIGEHELMRLISDHGCRVELRRRADAAIRFGKPFSIDLPIRTAAGEYLMVQVVAGPYHNASGHVTMLRGVIGDVTERVRAAADIERLISTDALTGLPNRNRFIALCAEAIARVRSSDDGWLAIVVLDLDGYKRINESLGQVAGDEAMCAIGDRLATILAAWVDRRAGDAAEGVAEPHLARLPGDEFAILLPRARDRFEIQGLIDTLSAGFRSPIVVADTDCFVSFCAGVALYPQDGEGAGKLLSRADAALASAKALGSRTVRWAESMRTTEAGMHLAMLGDLHRALERGEFELHYQPCVDATCATTVGVEALVRWRRDDALVPPGEFIELAEETGLIVPIGEWAIHQACAAMRAWRDGGVGIPRVSVNVSSLQFASSSLTDTVREAIRVHGLSPHLLELELTESCTVRDFDRTLGVLQALRKLGVGLALDDFGTGYSSLSYLTRLPIRTLKIDRSFVRLLGVSEEGEAVVRAIVALGRSLRLRLVAEGVETLRQAQSLLAMGCHDMQGFLFAPAVPASDLIAVIDRIRMNGATAGYGRRQLELPARAAALSGG